MNPQAPTTPQSGTITDGLVVENALLGGNRDVPLTATAERIYDKLVADQLKSLSCRYLLICFLTLC